MKIMHGNGPQIIGIVGGSCAGKTWLARRLREELGETAALLSLDDFYKDQSHLSAGWRARLNFDHPRCIDWARLEDCLSSCARRQAAAVPRYDFSTHSRLSAEGVLPPAPVIVVEGLWLFRRPRIRELFALKIFLRAHESLCVERRLERDTRERGRTREEVVAQWQRFTAPMYRQFVAPQEKWADLILEAPVGAREVSEIKNRIAENSCTFGL